MIAANQTFAIEIQPPSGSYMIVQRTIPASIGQSIINLNEQRFAPLEPLLRSEKAILKMAFLLCRIRDNNT